MADLKKLNGKDSVHIKETKIETALAASQKKTLPERPRLGRKKRSKNDLLIEHWSSMLTMSIQGKRYSEAINYCRRILRESPDEPHAKETLETLLSITRGQRLAPQSQPESPALRHRVRPTSQGKKTPSVISKADKEDLRTLEKGLRSLKRADFLPLTPCPDSWTLAAYVAGQLDRKTQREINGHIAFCNTCFDHFVALVGPNMIAEIVSTEEAEKS
jgi:hypothetical protein